MVTVSQISRMVPSTFKVFLAWDGNGENWQMYQINHSDWWPRLFVKVKKGQHGPHVLQHSRRRWRLVTWLLQLFWTKEHVYRHLTHSINNTGSVSLHHSRLLVDMPEYCNDTSVRGLYYIWGLLPTLILSHLRSLGSLSFPVIWKECPFPRSFSDLMSAWSCTGVNSIK